MYRRVRLTIPRIARGFVVPVIAPAGGVAGQWSALVRWSHSGLGVVLAVATGCPSLTEAQAGPATDTDVMESSTSGGAGTTTGEAESSTGSSTSTGPALTVTTDPSTSGTTDATTTGRGSSESGDASSSSSTSGEPCGGECPTGWDCIDDACVNPADGTPCPGGVSDCDVAAPFCGPDSMCHDGTDGDACYEGQCGVGLLCNSVGICQDGDENDPCTFNGGDCGPLAPFCGPDAMCHDGDDGDACYSGFCAVGFRCNPSGLCQDGDENDPCNFSGNDCGPLAPFCGPTSTCHNGDDGDPCYEGFCAQGFRCNPSGTCQDGDENDPCNFSGNDCGPAAPFCGPDALCHDGDNGDPCYAGDCQDGLTCEGAVCG